MVHFVPSTENLTLTMLNTLSSCLSSLWASGHHIQQKCGINIWLKWEDGKEKRRRKADEIRSDMHDEAVWESADS